MPSSSPQENIAALDGSPVPVLPPRRPYNNIEIPQAAGKWHSGTVAALKTIGDALDHGTTNGQARASELAKSTPDIWAQAEVFRAGLLDNNSLLHEQCAAEWRGMIALFALARIRGYEINVAHIELNKGDNRARRLIQTLRPIDQLFDYGNEWADIGVVSVSSAKTPPVAVGMLVPSIILCPGRSSPKLNEYDFPWMRNGRFGDPTSDDSKLLGVSDYRCLEDLCEHLRERLNTFKIEHIDAEKILGGLKEQLGLFTRAIGKRLAAMHDAQRGMITPWPLDCHAPYPAELYSALFRGPTIEHDGGKPRYDTMIPVRADLGSNVAGLLLADPMIAPDIRERVHKIVWGFSTLLSILPDAERSGLPEAERKGADDAWAKVSEQAKARGFRLVQPSDFFSEYLYELGANAGEILGHGPYKKFLLPVSRLALTVFDAAKLVERLEIIKADEGDVTVRLKLTLTTDKGNFYDHIISKTYPKEQRLDARQQGKPTALMLWPDFKDPLWSDYYIFCAGNYSNVFWPDAVINKNLLAKEFGGQSIDEDNVRTGSDTARFEWFESRSFPEAIECSAKLPNALIDHRVAVGILAFPPVNAAQISEMPSNAWRVAIDFGTTKTTVAVQSGKSTRLLEFKDRIVQAVTQEKNNLSWGGLQRQFVSAGIVSKPFITALETRNESWIQKPKPMLSSHIYFADDPDHYYSSLDQERDARLHTDLKWQVEGDAANGDRGRVLIRLFLHQVLMQACAEAFCSGVPYEKLTVRFSYPMAYDRYKKRRFDEAIRNALKGFQGRLEAAKNLDHSKSESDASAYYFYNENKARCQQPTVTIDIGGGTSDITVWQAKRQLWRGSAKIAGQDMLIRPMMGAPKLVKDVHQLMNDNDKDYKYFENMLNSFSQRLANSSLAAGTGEEARVPRDLLEMLLGVTKFGDYFIDNIHMLTAGEDGAALSAAITVGFGGLLFYVSQVIKYLSKENGNVAPIFKFQRAQILEICLGGRLTALLRELYDDRSGDSPELEGFGRLVCEASELGFQKVNFTFSKQPKEEVARGLLYIPPRIGGSGAADELDTTNASRVVLAGEKLRFHETVYPEDSLIGDLVPSVGRSDDFSIDGFTQMRRFLDILSKNLGVRVKWDDDVEAEVKHKLDDYSGSGIASLVMGDTGPATDDDPEDDGAVAEAPFIVGLRALVAAIGAGHVRASIRGPR